MENKFKKTLGIVGLAAAGMVGTSNLSAGEQFDQTKQAQTKQSAPGKSEVKQSGTAAYKIFESVQGLKQQIETATKLYGDVGEDAEMINLALTQMHDVNESTDTFLSKNPTLKPSLEYLSRMEKILTSIELLRDSVNDYYGHGMGKTQKPEASKITLRQIRYPIFDKEMKDSTSVKDALLLISNKLDALREELTEKKSVYDEGFENIKKLGERK